MALRNTLLIAGWALYVVAAQHAHSADTVPGYPKDAVKLVVSYAAGNATDLFARTLADKLTAKWQKPVVVENRAGAGGSLGAAFVAKSPPDGLTLLVTAVAAMAVNPHVYSRLGYDPLQDFDYVILAVWTPLVCVAPISFPASTFAEFVKYTKERPGQTNFGSAGSGNIPHLTMETLKSRYGLNVVHVPYKATASVLTDLVSARIQMACEPASVTAPFIQSGKLKAIAVTSNKRLPVLPATPTLAEQLGGCYTAGAWLGIMAPRGLPPAIIQKINADIGEILAERDVRAKFDALGFEILSEGPAAFALRVKTDFEQYRIIVQELNLKLE